MSLVGLSEHMDELAEDARLAHAQYHSMRSELLGARKRIRRMSRSLQRQNRTIELMCDRIRVLESEPRIRLTGPAISWSADNGDASQS